MFRGFSLIKASKTLKYGASFDRESEINLFLTLCDEAKLKHLAAIFL